MLSCVGIGFVIVAVCDYAYIKISQYRQYSIKMSTRRKIFHFVPLFLLPFLVQIHYTLFILMVYGSFYLFWILELLRHFGKLAKY